MFQAMLLQYARQCREIGMFELKGMSDRGKPFSCLGQILRIPFDADESAARAEPTKNLDAVPGPTNRTIDRSLAWLRIQRVQHRVEQDGAMLAGRG